MVIKKELLDELFASVDNPQDLMGEEGLLKKLKKALIERAMTLDRLTIDLLDHQVPLY
ncbi:hypothetical protein [Terasakiella sp. SH-1]|uniref:hypothetical protein n=1 Tax=Terasakiella sp. SH-1 TaxID=2560057 RepID=UPI001F0DE2B5|nr:hypothetical protein [Terasakiella sp. SH-1]